MDLENEEETPVLLYLFNLFFNMLKFILAAGLSGLLTFFIVNHRQIQKKKEIKPERDNESSKKKKSASLTTSHALDSDLATNNPLVTNFADKQNATATEISLVNKEKKIDGNMDGIDNMVIEDDKDISDQKDENDNIIEEDRKTSGENEIQDNNLENVVKENSKVTYQDQCNKYDHGNNNKINQDTETKTETEEKSQETIDGEDDEDSTVKNTYGSLTISHDCLSEKNDTLLKKDNPTNDFLEVNETLNSLKQSDDSEDVSSFEDNDEEGKEIDDEHNPHTLWNLNFTRMEKERRQSFIDDDLGATFKRKVSFPNRVCFWDDIRDGDLDAIKTYLKTHKNKDGIDFRNVLNSFTPFLMACYHGKQELAEYFMENGADINALDMNNDSGLHFAIINADINLAVLLLSRGANDQKENNEGHTPYDTAEDDTLELLDKALAAVST